MESEIEKLGLVLGGTGCGIAVIKLDEGGRILSVVSCNKSYCDRVGIEAVKVIGQNPMSIKEYDQKFLEQNVLNETMAGEMKCFECTWRRKDGREVTELTCIIPFKSDGNAYYMEVTQYSLLAHVTP